jgi:hypothetical protein
MVGHGEITQNLVLRFSMYVWSSEGVDTSHEVFRIEVSCYSESDFHTSRNNKYEGLNLDNLDNFKSYATV